MHSRIFGNRTHANFNVGISLNGDSTGNRILRNQATGNTEDMYHEPSASPNHWQGNTCEIVFSPDVDCP